MTQARLNQAMLALLVLAALVGLGWFAATHGEKARNEAFRSIPSSDASRGPVVLSSDLDDDVKTEQVGFVRSDSVSGELSTGERYEFDQKAPTAAAMSGHDADGNQTPGAANPYPSAATLRVWYANDDAELAEALRKILSDRNVTVEGGKISSSEIVALRVRHSGSQSVVEGIYPAEVCDLPAHQQLAMQAAACAAA